MTVKSDASADLRQDGAVVEESKDRSGTAAWASLVGDVGAVVGGICFLVALNGWLKLIAVGLILYGLIHGSLWIRAHRRR
jgi:hypothetical protein